MYKLVIDDGRKRVFDAENLKDIKIRESDNGVIVVTILSSTEKEANWHLKFSCLESYKNEILDFFSKENSIDINSRFFRTYSQIHSH